MTERDVPHDYFDKYPPEELQDQAELLLGDFIGRLSVSEKLKNAFLTTALRDSGHSLENYTVFQRGKKEIKVACRNNHNDRSVRVLIKEGQFSREAWVSVYAQERESRQATGLIHFTSTKSRLGEPDLNMIRHNTPEAVELVREVFNEAFPAT